MTSLEAVLGAWRADAQVLRKRGRAHDADVMEQLAREVSDAATEYLTWLTETKAMRRSGQKAGWLRARFPAWERQGHARREGRERTYRMVVVPHRANVEAARENGRRAAASEND